MSKIVTAALAAALLSAPLSQAYAGPRDDIIAAFKAQTGGAAAQLENGRAMFSKTFSTGKPDTPSCTTCHSADPKRSGQTRTGKAIDPLAVSQTPARFTDKKKVDKWFRRNCTSVIGRECTAQEKVDFLSYMSSQ